MDFSSVFSSFSLTEILWIYVAMGVASALVQSLPDPKEINNIWYSSFHKFLSILILDFKSYSQNFFPQALPGKVSSTGNNSTSGSTGDKANA